MCHEHHTPGSTHRLLHHWVLKPGLYERNHCAAQLPAWAHVTTRVRALRSCQQATCHCINEYSCALQHAHCSADWSSTASMILTPKQPDLCSSSRALSVPGLELVWSYVRRTFGRLARTPMEGTWCIASAPGGNIRMRIAVWLVPTLAKYN